MSVRVCVVVTSNSPPRLASPLLCAFEQRPYASNSVTDAERSRGLFCGGL